MAKNNDSDNYIDLPYKGKLDRVIEKGISSYVYSYSNNEVPIVKLGKGVPLISFGLVSLGSGRYLGRLRGRYYNIDIYDNDVHNVAHLIDLHIDSVAKNLLKIRNDLPDSFVKAAIYILMDGYNQKLHNQLFELINEPSLVVSFDNLSKLAFADGYCNLNGKSDTYKSIMMRIILFKTKETTARTLLTYPEKKTQREKERSAAAKLLLALKQGMSDSPINELCVHIEKSEKLSARQKLSYSTYASYIERAKNSMPGFALAPSPLFSELLESFIWALDNTETDQSITEYGGINSIDNADLKLFDTTDPVVRFERDFLSNFKTYYGKIPTCAWQFLNYCHDGDRPKSTSQRYYNDWKNKP